MKTKEFVVIIFLAIFLGLGFGMKYLIDQAEPIDTSEDRLGNLVLEKLGTNLYSLTGDVGEGDCEAVIPQLPTIEPFTMILESPGGSLMEGLCIAANLKVRNVITVVRNTQVLNENGEVVYHPGANTEQGIEMSKAYGKPVTICASACGLIFLAGDERYLMGDVYFGIHSPRSASPIQDGAVAEASAYETSSRLLYFLEHQLGMGSSDLRRLFISVPASSMYYLHHRDFQNQLHLRDLATHYVDFYGYTWSDPRASLEAAIIQQRIQLRKAQEYQESGGV